MKKQRNMLIALVVVCCVAMSVVDGIIRPGYFIKSAVKIVLFLGAPLVYSLTVQHLDVKKLFKIKKDGLVQAAVLGFMVYGVIVGGYFVFKNIFDFSAITQALEKNTGVSKENFVFVSLYISFINSLLEEFFFRGFAFLTLKRFSTRRTAYMLSAGVFSLYHVAMVSGWFSPFMFLLMVAGLFVGGLIFNYLNERNDNIYTSWTVHICANFAINTVGFILFGYII